MKRTKFIKAVQSWKVLGGFFVYIGKEGRKGND